jgi:hypothetical protein
MMRDARRACHYAQRQRSSTQPLSAMTYAPPYCAMRVAAG